MKLVVENLWAKFCTKVPVPRKIGYSNMFDRILNKNELPFMTNKTIGLLEKNICNPSPNGGSNGCRKERDGIAQMKIVHMILKILFRFIPSCKIAYPSISLKTGNFIFFFKIDKTRSKLRNVKKLEKLKIERKKHFLNFLKISKFGTGAGAYKDGPEI